MSGQESHTHIIISDDSLPQNDCQRASMQSKNGMLRSMKPIFGVTSHPWILIVIVASCILFSDAALVDFCSDEFIEDHEWRIHGVVLDPPQEDLSPHVLETARHMTIEDARDWCKQHDKCAAIFFSPESFSSMLTVDLVIFISATPRTSNYTTIERIQDTLRQEVDEDKSWVVHVVNDRSEKTIKRKSLEKVSYRPYRHCCREEVNSNEDFPTMEELSEAENIERVPCNISRPEFVEKYESQHIPVILEGCAEHWPAMKRWVSLKSFSFSNDTMWANDCKGRRQSWSEVQEDIARGFDLGIFDQMQDYGEKSKLLKDFEVPPPFQNGDIYEQLPSVLSGIGRMAWFSMGQTWFGSDPHQDFHLPSPEQWNTLIRGTKLWALFPPTNIILENEDNVKCDPTCSSLAPPVFTGDWFHNVALHAHKYIYEDGMRPLFFVQHPGDTVYVPDKWLHSLFNLEDCIAVTQGYGSITNLAEIWKQVIVKGDDKDWRKLYYSMLNGKQRKVARDAVQKEEVCVAYYGAVARGEKLCKKHSFFSRLEKNNSTLQASCPRSRF